MISFRTVLLVRTLSLLSLAWLGCATAPGAAPGGQGCRDQDPVTSAPAKDGARPFDVAKHKDFAGYQAALEDYVARNTSLGQADFCIVGFAHGEDWRKAWVLWPQGDRIIEWGGEPEMVAPRELNLKTDVVASEDEIRGSTYLVTREWVKRLRDACSCFGRSVHIVR